jgi:APA family basic amino acid/polyamine antiporter
MATDLEQRKLGLFGATQIGIGAIVGGGILVLSGPAFLATGPSAVIAFALNGILAFITAMSFAEMVSAYPRSGGAYAFGRRVLSVRVAFGVGWVLWLAYLVAGVLYALGFGIYMARLISVLLPSMGMTSPAWLSGHGGAVALAVLAVALYTLSLIRKSAAGGSVAAWGKIVVLSVLVLVGIWVFFSSEAGTAKRGMTPFLPNGTIGLLSAMGLSFIAFQGFDLIATVASEIEAPERNIPRAMFYSLGTAIAIYLPLLLIVATVGVEPGSSITAMATNGSDTLMATAVGNYMGPTGTWLVLIAAVLSTLSALNANLLAASRVAHTMALDRTLPWVIGLSDKVRGTPTMALYSSALAMGALLFMVPDLSTAGAAASLIFLVSFALTHYTAFLARRRQSTVRPNVYRSPFFPLVPIVGGLACTALAVFQAVAQPNAGAVVAVWLGLGVVLYRAVFASRAQIVDAAAEGGDDELVRLRGRSPLMLVPVNNPDNAAALVQLASALTPPQIGKVLLLSVVRRGMLDPAVEIQESLAPIQHGMQRAYAEGRFPESMTTIGDDPWAEIARVARERNCERMLLGLTDLGGNSTVERLEELLNQVDCDLSILRAPPRWDLSQVKRILVPVGGQGNHDELRARLLASLGRNKNGHINFLRIVNPATSQADCKSLKRSLERSVPPEIAHDFTVTVIRSAAVQETIMAHAMECDLVVLGLQRTGQQRKAFGQLSLDLARETETAMIMLGGRQGRSFIWRP